jgi:Tfp pilus assembly protein PilN
MAYNGIAWPGVSLSIKAITSQRGKVVRGLRLLEEQPKLFKNPRRETERRRREVADYDTALKVLRDVQKAAEAPPRKRRKSAEKTTVEPNG